MQPSQGYIRNISWNWSYIQGVQRSTVIFEFKISPSWIISTSKHWCLFWSWDRRQSFYGIKLCQVLPFGWIITILHFSRFTTTFAPKHFSNANPNTNFAHICIWYITFGWYNVISCLKFENKPKSMKSNKINFQKIPKLKRRKWRNFEQLWFLGKVLAILIT